MSDWKDKAKRLKEHGWNDQWSTAFAWAGGRCEYCGCDLLHDRTAYEAGTLDHLLPKSAYPELEDCENNLVLACRSCNTIKSTFDVAGKYSGVTMDFLKANRDQFITDARKHIYARRAENHDRNWLYVQWIMSG